MAFVFGLLHGLGFAGALREVGLPDDAIPLALAFFNVGVESGQLLFVAAVFLFFRLVNQLILLGGIEGEERVVAPDGTKLILQESQNRRFIRVRAE